MVKSKCVFIFVLKGHLSANQKQVYSVVMVNAMRSVLSRDQQCFSFLGFYIKHLLLVVLLLTL